MPTFMTGDFFLSSLAPFHAMQHEGVIDHNVRYIPVLDGLSKPGYMQWYFDPITDYPVQSLEELSDRSNAGSRCFERMLMCKPYSLWYLSPGRQWHDRLKFGMLGQEVWCGFCRCFRPTHILCLILTFAMYEQVLHSRSICATCL